MLGTESPVLRECSATAVSPRVRLLGGRRGGARQSFFEEHGHVPVASRLHAVALLLVDRLVLAKSLGGETADAHHVRLDRIRGRRGGGETTAVLDTPPVDRLALVVVQRVAHRLPGYLGGRARLALGCAE